jgi:hypothetical protein
MQLQYQIDEPDYLAHYMFADAKSASLRKRRRLRRFLVPIPYTLAGLFFLIGAAYSTASFFLITAVVWLVFHPSYSKWMHKRHYLKHVRENYKNRINTEVALTLNAEEIMLKDSGNEVKIKSTEFDSLSETQDHYFLRTKSNSVIILPKHTIKDQEALKSIISFLRNELKIVFHDELNWRWK